VRTAGPAAAIRLSLDRDSVRADAGDVAHLTIEIVDSAGRVVPSADHLLQVAVTGGTLLALDNGDLKDHTPYRSDRRQALNGRAMAIIRGAQPGPLRMTVSADGLGSASISVAVIRGSAPAAIPPAR
jgi:beta-galactosidase